jgi:hypothetical protein
MPEVRKSKKILEIGSFFQSESLDSPVSHLLQDIKQRTSLQITLTEALHKMGLGQFSHEISLGEINEKDEIKLIAQKAAIISKLKNKLPSLLNFFRESGFPLKGIHLKVTPKAISVALSPSTSAIELIPITIGNTSKKAWQDLLNDLEIDSPVHQAVKELLKKIN